MRIYCVECAGDVEARLTSGKEIYPHRGDLYKLNFWIHDVCRNYIGCHKGGSGKQPLGIIPNKQLKFARIKIHQVLDPIWKQKKLKRHKLYSRISKIVGWNYHTANIRNIDEAREVYRAILEIKKSLITK